MQTSYTPANLDTHNVLAAPNLTKALVHRDQQVTGGGPAASKCRDAGHGHSVSDGIHTSGLTPTFLLEYDIAIKSGCHPLILNSVASAF